MVRNILIILCLLILIGGCFAICKAAFDQKQDTGTFVTTDASTKKSITTDKTVYEEGDAIWVTPITDSPYDKIVVYAADQQTKMICWRYVGEGINANADACGKGSGVPVDMQTAYRSKECTGGFEHLWEFPPGKYVIYLIPTTGEKLYSLSATITIVERTDSDTFNDSEPAPAVDFTN